MSHSFSSARLAGHRAPVTCLKFNGTNLLLSGAEDATVRVWDIRTCRTVKCFVSCFGSNDIEAISFGKNENIAYVACSESICSFDLRLQGVVCREPLSQVNIRSEGGDEINTIAVNTKGDLLAAAMDSGVVNLVPLRSNGSFTENSGSTRYKRLCRVHTNIVNSINFRKNNPQELISGGFDYVGCIWDIGKGRPKASTNFQQSLTGASDIDVEASASTGVRTGSGGGSDASAAASAGVQIVNPPFVMNIDYVCDGRCVMAGLGNGHIRILNTKDMSPCVTIEAHNCMISALHSDNKYSIISGGTDCMINMHVLRVDDGDGGGSSAMGSSSGGSSSGGGGKGGKKKNQPLPPLQLHAEKVFSLEHSGKINAIESTLDLGAIFAPTSTSKPPPPLSDGARSVDSTNCAGISRLSLDTVAIDSGSGTVDKNAINGLKGMETLPPAITTAGPDAATTAELRDGTFTAGAASNSSTGKLSSVPREEGGNEKHVINQLYVADVSNEITLYTFK